MKTVIMILVSIFFVSNVVAQDAMKEIKITKEWKINPNSAFELSAKNEGFRVEFWEKDNVRIDFILKTNKSSFTKDDLEEMIVTSATNAANKLSISTDMDIDKSSSIWNWIVKTKDKITKTTDYATDNVIYLPKNISNLSFILNYTSLKIGNINLPLKISSNYSDVSIAKNTNKTIISSSYADIKLGDLSNVKINSNYGDFIIDNIDTLNSSTSYCDIKLTNCPFIQSLSSNYGDVVIQKAGSIKTNATYSDIKINSLLYELNANITYSDLSINDVAKTLKGINIACTYSDNKIKINPENPIAIKINDVNGDIDIKNPKLQLNISRSETGATTNVTAKTKTATDASPIIKITSNTSDIKIY